MRSNKFQNETGPDLDLPKLRILHTNDFHGTLDERRFEQLSVLRKRADLYFDTGDAVKSGNLAIPLRQDPVWNMLSRLRCDASVLGNRETHVLESAFQAKLGGLSHPALCANLRLRNGDRPLPSNLILDSPAGTVGVFGVMVPMVTDAMATKVASAYRWDNPLAVAAEEVAELRHRVDVLIALTHIGIAQDRELAVRCPDIDVILGGHSHTVLATPERIGTTWIAQGGSHGRYAGNYEFESGVGLTGELVALSQ